jgi:hypothetical protein
LQDTAGVPPPEYKSVPAIRLINKISAFSQYATEKHKFFHFFYFVAPGADYKKMIPDAFAGML